MSDGDSVQRGKGGGTNSGGREVRQRSRQKMLEIPVHEPHHLQYHHHHHHHRFFTLVQRQKVELIRGINMSISLVRARFQTPEITSVSVYVLTTVTF